MRDRGDIRAVLFDVGGPIDVETEHERRAGEAIVAALAAEGIDVTPAQLADASAHAVATYAPDAYAAMIWHLAAGDVAVAERAFAAFRDRMAAHTPALELRDGIGDVLAWLRGLGLKLGLAANQPARVLSLLDACGVGVYFDHREVAGTHGYRKPDVRLFLRCCDDLGVRPEQCIMVGDRIDNDVAPARLLGMRAVLFRTGRHAGQQPRSRAEVPDAEVHDIAGLRTALGELIARSA